MNGHNVLELTMRDILWAINPTQEDWALRFHIISELRAIIESIESLRGATVEPFGSFVSNLFTRWGDLDISIELQNGSYIASPGKKQKQSLLGDALKEMRKKGGFHRLQFISNARVPILKLESKYNISCDISINNLIGQMKSKLLFWINEIDGRFRDLILLVKEWAKAHRINDSKSGTLNSYSLSLLVIFHLQTTAPAILPPLQEIYPGNLVADLQGVRTVAEKHIEDICGVNINKIRSDKSRLINQSSLSELFISFLAKFSDICSKASTHGISPYTGQSEEILSNTRWLPKTYALFVEDPFEQPANTARTVGANQLTKITEAVRVTYGTVISRNQNKASLLQVLAGPYTSQSILKPGVPSQAPSQSTSSRPPNHMNNQRRKNKGKAAPTERKQMPSQAPKQSGKNKSTAEGQNGVTNGPVDAPKSQKQQVWRPRSSETKADKSTPSHSGEKND